MRIVSITLYKGLTIMIKENEFAEMLNRITSLSKELYSAKLSVNTILCKAVMEVGGGTPIQISYDSPEEEVRINNNLVKYLRSGVSSKGYAHLQFAGSDGKEFRDLLSVSRDRDFTAIALLIASLATNEEEEESNS